MALENNQDSQKEAEKGKLLVYTRKKKVNVEGLLVYTRKKKENVESAALQDVTNLDSEAVVEVPVENVNPNKMVTRSQSRKKKGEDNEKGKEKVKRKVKVKVKGKMRGKVKGKEKASNSSEDFRIGLPIPVRWIESGSEACMVPDLSIVDQWSSTEADSFLLALCLFGKQNMLQVQRFVGKEMGQILRFFYGAFYNSTRFKVWKQFRILEMLKGKAFLNRMLLHASNKDVLQYAYKQYCKEKMVVEDYAFALKQEVHMDDIVKASGIKALTRYWSMPEDDKENCPPPPATSDPSATSCRISRRIIDPVNPNRLLPQFQHQITPLIRLD